MRDMDVRSALHSRLVLEHAAETAGTRFVDELGLCGRVRVDVAVVNGALSGYELKSDADTLKRLPTQAAVYSQVLDAATLVVGTRHLHDARQIVPRWWGLISASSTAAGPVVLRDVRSPRPNPSIEPHALVQLLWRSETLAELEARGCADGVRSKSRLEIWNRLVDSTDLDELRAVVRTRLKAREGWRSG